jgi:hypothetical protein
VILLKWMCSGEGGGDWQIALSQLNENSCTEVFIFGSCRTLPRKIAGLQDKCHSLYAVSEPLTLSFQHPVNVTTDIIMADICNQKFSIPLHIYDFQ